MHKIIHLNKSRQYIFVISFLHAIAVLAFAALSMILVVKLLCTLGCLLSFFYILYQHQNNNPRQIEIVDTSKLIFKTKKLAVKVKVLNSCMITEFYICLHCKDIDAGKKYYFVLMRDNFKEKGQYRHFSAWLKQSAI